MPLSIPFSVMHNSQGMPYTLAQYILLSPPANIPQPPPPLNDNLTIIQRTDFDKDFTSTNMHHSLKYQNIS